MKTSITLFCLLLICGNIGKTQTETWNVIPQKAMDTIRRVFPDAGEITWKRSADHLRARFQNGSGESESITLFFDQGGHLMDVLHDIQLDQLPEDVIYSATSTHQGYDIKEAYQVEHDRPEALYELHLQKRGEQMIKVRINARGYLVTHVPAKR